MVLTTFAAVSDMLQENSYVCQSHWLMDPSTADRCTYIPTAHVHYTQYSIATYSQKNLKGIKEGPDI